MSMLSAFFTEYVDKDRQQDVAAFFAQLYEALCVYEVDIAGGPVDIWPNNQIFTSRQSESWERFGEQLLVVRGLADAGAKPPRDGTKFRITLESELGPTIAFDGLTCEGLREEHDKGGSLAHFEIRMKLRRHIVHLLRDIIHEESEEDLYERAAWMEFLAYTSIIDGKEHTTEMATTFFKMEDHVRQNNGHNISVTDHAAATESIDANVLASDISHLVQDMLIASRLDTRSRQASEFAISEGESYRHHQPKWTKNRKGLWTIDIGNLRRRRNFLSRLFCIRPDDGPGKIS